MKNALFAPIGIGAGLLAGLISKKTFDLIWGKVSGEEAPRPDQREVGWVQLGSALLVEGAVFRLTKGLVDHTTRAGFQRLTGAWPGEEGPDPA
jgi:Protein of unknown function (DUF4235)